MENNENRSNPISGTYKESSGTGVISSIIFAVVVTIVLSIAAHFIG